MRKKVLRYASVAYDVEVDKNPEDAYHQLSLSSKAAGVIRCDSIESTPSRSSLESVMAGGFTSFPSQPPNNVPFCFGFVFQIHPH
jgi:hypothetical protein